MEIAPLGQRLPLWSFMKTKLKVISSKIRKSVRKLMPQPCRAFSPTPSRLQFPEKAWIVLASASVRPPIREGQLRAKSSPGDCPTRPAFTPLELYENQAKGDHFPGPQIRRVYRPHKREAQHALRPPGFNFPADKAGG